MNDCLNDPVMALARKDFATLGEKDTVRKALDDIRLSGLGEKIVYFYVVNSDGCLVGVLPTRRLLTAPLDTPIHELMLTGVVTIPESATASEARHLMHSHRLMALPVVNQEGHILGIVDVGMFTSEEFEAANRLQVDEVFEIIGFQISDVRDASPHRIFRFRFPWLLATIGGGSLCAILAGFYETTLAESLVLAFFLTLVLGLGESVSSQSMTVTIQALRSRQPTLRWYFSAFWREVRTAFLLGMACGVIVGAIVLLWRGDHLAAMIIGGSILLVICAACLFGLSIPSLLHALKLDPKVAAGPVTLAVTDICTILIYFSLARMLL
mgnify:CR=1 FL=1